MGSSAVQFSEEKERKITRRKRRHHSSGCKAKVALAAAQTREDHGRSPDRVVGQAGPAAWSGSASDTFFVSHLKGVGKVYLQTAVDCHARYAWGRLYPNKLPVTAVHLMNNDVLPHL